MTEFETWWYNEGSAAPIPGEDSEEHCKRMCQIAWENGAFCAVQPDRQALQSAGTHPAPCARHCEAQAFEIAARGMRRQIAELQAALKPPAQPLTDEQIDKLPWGPHEGNPMTFAEGLRDFARAIEAAHGITKGNT